MQQNANVLIGIDGSESAKGAVAYAAKFYDPQQTRVMLMHVEETISHDVTAPKDAEIPVSNTIDIQTVRERVMDGVRNVMGEAADILKNSGFADKSVGIKIQQRERGVARDLMTEAGKGYNAVLVGRRGLTMIKDFLMGRVSMKLLHRAHKMAVWIA